MKFCVEFMKMSKLKKKKKLLVWVKRVQKA